MIKIGQTLKTLRKSNGIKQGILADRVGVTQAYISAIEADKRLPRLDLLNSICEEIDVPMEFVFALSSIPCIDNDVYHFMHKRWKNLALEMVQFKK